MGQSFNASDILRRAIADQLIANFDHTVVTGLASRPVITRTITSRTPEPYIYVREEGSIEDFNTKGAESRRHTIAIEIVFNYNSMRGSHIQRDQTVNQVVSICTTEPYPDLRNMGYDVWLVHDAEVTTLDPFEERGARYFKSIIFIDYVICELTTGRLEPVQDALFTFENFMITPTGRQIECFDAGTIIGATTYPSSNNGWNFTTVDYALVPNAEGTLATNRYTIGETDHGVIGLMTTINYEFATDTTATTSVMDTDNWARIRSLRSGSWDFGTFDPSRNYTFTAAELADIEEFRAMNRTIHFGMTNPNEQTIAIQQRIGEHIYIVQDASLPHIVDIRPAHLSTNASANFIDQFDINTITTACGDYRVYVRDCPAGISGSLSLTLFT